MKQYSRIFFLGFVFSFVLVFKTQAQGLTEKQIDSLVQETMQAFEVPGMAVAVIKDGEFIVKKGYGLRSVQTKKPVDEHTLFGIASISKAFTATALAQLIDEGKLHWDTKVTDIIPEFKLYDAYVTREFNVRDLLTHRSGLGLGAGDLMLWPTTNTTTLDELIHNLRYLKPVSSFRTKYDYDNLLYIVAGEIVARVSGKTYEEYIHDHIFDPVQMTDALLDWEVIETHDNKIVGHGYEDGGLKPRKRKPFSAITAAAGGIFASVEDMGKWMELRLNMGEITDQDRLYSYRQAQEMWTPQTIIPTGTEEYKTHFKAYGLGWRLQDVNGHLKVWHTGGLSGIVSKLTLIPELNLGIVVLTNKGSSAAYNAVTNSVLDGYFDLDCDRIQQLKERQQQTVTRASKVEKEVNDQVAENSRQNIEGIFPEKLVGTYKDPWFGKVKIETTPEGKLQFTSEKSPDLKGRLKFYKETVYVVYWDDQSINANAFVNFGFNNKGEIEGFTMDAVSPLTDFSYDFQDLDFTRK